jgi:serine protease Do
LRAIGEATDRVASSLEPSLVFVEVTVSGGGGGGRPRGPAPGGSQQVGITGLVLTSDGTLLLPVALPKDQVQDLKVWSAGKEYKAEVLKVEDKLQMTLVRVQSEGATFSPVPSGDRAFPGRGEWLVTLVRGGKDADYQAFPGLGMVRGKVSGVFDQIILEGGSVGMGTVLADLDGRVVGIARPPQVLFFPEVLQKLDLDKRSLEVAQDSGEEGDEEGGLVIGKGKPWIGITMDTLNEDFAEVSGLPKEAILVRDVFADSPAAKGGLKPMDLIVGVNRKPLTRPGPKALEQFNKFLNPVVGKDVTFDLLRDGQRLGVTCRFEKAPEAADLQADDLGIQVRELTEPLFRMTPGVYQREGVLVTSVVSGSAASRKMQPGDVIVALDRKTVRDLKAFTAVLEDLRRRKAEVVLVKVCRGKQTVYVALDLTLRLHGKGDKS